LTLINDILDFSKIEAGLLVIEEYAFDVVETVESVAELLYPLASAKGVSLFVYILLDRLMHNLLSNLFFDDFYLCIPAFHK
jgi:signal transduction histidine kinase